MKLLPTLLCAALLGSAALLAAPAARAQVNININPPAWGPPVPQGAQYYYIPETNGFYDVPARQYVVLREGRWVRVGSLSGYNPANFHPVVVDYVGAQPWSRYDEYRGKYGKKRNPSNGGLPPGQAKKQGYRNNDRDDDRDHGRDIIVRLPDGRYYNERRDDDRRGDGDDYGKDKGKYKNKGKGRKDKD